MPHYDFLCHACSRTFPKVLTRAEFEEGKATCPNCGSANVEQRWSAFYAITSKKARDGSHARSRLVTGRCSNQEQNLNTAV